MTALHNAIMTILCSAIPTIKASEGVVFVGSNLSSFSKILEISNDQKEKIEKAIDEKFFKKYDAMLEDNEIIKYNTDANYFKDNRQRPEIVYNTLKSNEKTIIITIFENLYKKYHGNKTTYICATRLFLQGEHQLKYRNLITNIIIDAMITKQKFERFKLTTILRQTKNYEKLISHYKLLIKEIITKNMFVFSIIDYIGNYNQAFYFIKKYLSKSIRSIIKNQEKNLLSQGIVVNDFGDLKLNLQKRFPGIETFSYDEKRKSYISLFENFVFLHFDEVRFICMI
ncbi:hypothetical protein COBT_000652 [Conglomerata obtusa]